MSEKTKEKAIIEAAKERFAHFGFSKVTMEEIASDVDLGKASLYYYFPTKEDLFKAVISLEQNKLKENFEALLQRNTAASKKLQEYVDLRMKFFRDLINLGTLSVHSYFDTKSVIKEVFINFEKIELELIKKIIIEGKKAKEFKPKLTEDTALIFLHTLQGLRCRVLRWAKGQSLDSKTNNDLQKEMSMVTEIFIDGISNK
jgi:TetR/AcrR family transcriptional regulator